MSAVTNEVVLDEAKLNEFLGRVVGDMGAAISAVMVRIGDRLGLYKALAAQGPATPAELAKRTSCAERYVREWLDNQASGGYVVYDPKTGRYALPPEQAAALADESSPALMLGGFQIIDSIFRDARKMEERFKNGDGMAWGDHSPDLFEGTERFFRPGYVANLVAAWIPALDGVKAKLEKGAKVADVGCGLGASTILMAKAFPRSTFVGFDYHGASIEAARERARAAGVGDRVRFEVAGATDFPGNDYDLVCHFDCFHDLADPAGAAARVKKALAKDGTWMLVEPFANDRPEENHNPVGRVFYGASTMLCVPCSLHGHGPALGAQAGEKRLAEIIGKAGFANVRRATQTPFNLILEAKA
ncbi:MAG TPA: class I SAM-dependent methyltransferase [bacterium]|nr:class I SAM-dependent methyltransferase [bacterium]